MYEYEHHDELGGLLEDAEYETYQMWMSETCDETRRVDKKKQLCVSCDAPHGCGGVG